MKLNSTAVNVLGANKGGKHALHHPVCHANNQKSSHEDVVKKVLFLAI